MSSGFAGTHLLTKVLEAFSLGPGYNKQPYLDRLARQDGGSARNARRKRLLGFAEKWKFQKKFAIAELVVKTSSLSDPG